MKNPGNSAKLLDLPFAPEAEQLLDELERTGQFRVGLEAEAEDEAVDPAATIEYSWGRGSGSVTIQDWYLGGSHQVEKITAGDGKSLASTKVNALVTAMSAFAPPAQGQTTLPANVDAALSKVIASSWR